MTTTAQNQGHTGPALNGRAMLEAFLAAHDLPFATHTHEAVFTVDQSQGVHDMIAGAHTKNLFLKDRKGRHFLVSALHDTIIDLKGLHKFIGASGRLSFASPAALDEILGVIPGAVTPLALMRDRAAQRVRFVLDIQIMAFARVNFHPLENTASFTLACRDFLRFCDLCDHRPVLFDFRADPPQICQYGDAHMPSGAKGPDGTHKQER